MCVRAYNASSVTCKTGNGALQFLPLFSQFIALYILFVWIQSFECQQMFLPFPKSNNFSNSLSQSAVAYECQWWWGFFLFFLSFNWKAFDAICTVFIDSKAENSKERKTLTTNSIWWKWTGQNSQKLLWMKCHAILSKLDRMVFPLVNSEKTNDHNHFTENVCIFPGTFALKTERTTIQMSKFMETEPTMSNLWLSSVRRMFQMVKDYYTALALFTFTLAKAFGYDGTMLAII